MAPSPFPAAHRPHPWLGSHATLGLQDLPPVRAGTKGLMLSCLTQLPHPGRHPATGSPDRWALWSPSLLGFIMLLADALRHHPIPRSALPRLFDPRRLTPGCPVPLRLHPG